MSKEELVPLGINGTVGSELKEAVSCERARQPLSELKLWSKSALLLGLFRISRASRGDGVRGATFESTRPVDVPGDGCAFAAV